jgi:hypothetical protein
MCDLHDSLWLLKHTAIIAMHRSITARLRHTRSTLIVVTPTYQHTHYVPLWTYQVIGLHIVGFSAECTAS